MTRNRTDYNPRLIPVPRPGRSPGGGSRTPAQVRGPLGDLTVADLRHPTEPSRFALALVALSVAIAVALFVMVSLGQATLLVAIFVAIALAVLLIWVVVQILRIRLLGDAVLVSAQTLPEVQQIVDVVRARLAYTRRVDLFVVDRISRVLSVDAAPITLTSFFGVHVLVAEGGALGDLAEPQEREQLLFTLATFVGALKARYAQWSAPIFTAFQMTGLTVFVWPFVYPYYRATVYSGDRIAFACCGDLDVSLQSVYRALVGKEVAPHLRAEGLTGQALVARRRWLLRFAQLLRPTPHATNRYLELLAFVRERTPEAFEALRPALGVRGAEAEPVFARMGGRRGHPSAVAVGVCLSFALLGGGLAVGLTARNSSVAQAIADAFGAVSDSGGGDSSGGGDGSGGGSTVSSSASPPVVNADAQRLLGLLPESVRSSCTGGSGDPAAGLQALVSCSRTEGGPEQLLLYAYSTPAAMSAAFDQLAGDLPSGSCADGASRGTWEYQNVTQGPLACYRSASGHTTIVWGSDAQGVLIVARDPAWSPSALFDWWRTDAAYLQ